MKSIAIFLLLGACSLPLLVKAQQVPAPSQAYCNTTDSLAKVLNSRLPADVSVIFTTSENCSMRISAPDGIKVTSYHLSRNLNGNMISTTFTNDLVTISDLTSLPKGTKVYFENIRVKTSDGSVRKLPAVMIVM